MLAGVSLFPLMNAIAKSLTADYPAWQITWARFTGHLLVIAIVGKIAAGWAFVSKQSTNRLVVGLGMMPRGEVGLIFLGLGTSAGLLSPSLEAAILVMVIGTTFLAPVLLRLVLGGNTPDGGDKVDDSVAADPVGLV